MLERESIQRANARLDPARREEENEQQHTRREQPGVLEHESIQRANARLDPERREEENEQWRTRREQHGVLEHEARQRRMADANKHVYMATKFVNDEYMFHQECGSWDFKPRCRCWCRRRCWCLSVCKEFLCGKYDILSGVWLSVSCVCYE